MFIFKRIKISNYDTEKVIDMSSMFSGCSSLKELNLSNYNTEKVIDMNSMFSGWLSIKKLNLNNINTINLTDMRWMFSRCSDDLKKKMRSQTKKPGLRTFENYDIEKDY